MRAITPITRLGHMPEAARQLALAAVCSQPGALLTDVDGTIAPIAATPEAARVLPQVPALLQQARERFAVVGVMSGRDVASLWRMLPMPGIVYIGDHGNHIWEAGATINAAPPPALLDAEVARVLTAFGYLPLAHAPGIRIEPKGATAAIHYRNTADPATMRNAVLAALIPLAAGTATRIAEGKMVIEIQALRARNKGDALRELAQTRHLRGLVYLGDDRTDIDAFVAARELRATGACQTCVVAIGAADVPPELLASADLALASITLVPAMIAWLITLAQE